MPARKKSMRKTKEVLRLVHATRLDFKPSLQSLGSCFMPSVGFCTLRLLMTVASSSRSSFTTSTISNAAHDLRFTNNDDAKQQRIFARVGGAGRTRTDA